MFLNRVTMQKPLEIQQKRPAVKNKQAISKAADRDQMSGKVTVKVFGASINR